MSDPASTEMIRFARSPAFRDKIRYISADSRCKNVWRLSTTVPGYFPQYKGFSSFLDTETIRVISCILFHEELSASILHILGDIQVERLWLLGRAIDAVQAIKCRVTEWAAAAPALLTLADHQHELVGLGDRRTQHFDHIMWYTKAALMLANDHLLVNEQLDWNKPEYALSLYLYLKKEQGVCLCVHREGLSHASCCATLFKLYSLPIEALRGANASLFGEADPSTRPRSELRGLMGKLKACGYPVLPPTINHNVHSASIYFQQVPNAPKALRYGAPPDQVPSAPSSTTTLTSATNARSAATPLSPSKQPPNAPRALMFNRMAPPSQPRRPPTPQHGQNMAPSSNGSPSIPSNDHTKRSSSASTMPTMQHQLPPRPLTLETPPQPYYGRSGVYVGKRPTYPLVEAMGKPESYSTSPREHVPISCQPLNQYIMQPHPPQPVYHSDEPPPIESNTSEIIATTSHLQSAAHKQRPTHAPLHLVRTSTSTLNGSLSSSVSRRSTNLPASVHNKTADYDGRQSKRAEKRIGGDGGGKVYSHTKSLPSDANVAEMIAKSPESGEADMEVDDTDSRLGTILAVAEDGPKQSVSEVADDPDLQPDKNGSEGRPLKRVAPTIGSRFAGVGSSGGGTQAAQQSPPGQLGTGAEKEGITPPSLNERSAGANLVEGATTQVLSQSHRQKPDDPINDGGDAGRLFPRWRSSNTDKTVSFFHDEPLQSHREQNLQVPERQPGSTAEQSAVALDSGETGTGNGDRLHTSEGNGRSVEIVDARNIHGAADVAAQTAASLEKTPNTPDNKKPETATLPSPAIAVKEAAALGSSPAESPIRRSTRSSMGLLKKKSYAEFSDGGRASINRPRSRSGSKGAGAQAAKQKRNDAGGMALPGATGAKTSRSVPNAQKPLTTVAASASTPNPVKEIPDWEVQLRKMPNWEFELEMWKERELFRCRTTGHWDDRPFNVELPQERRWQTEVTEMRANGYSIPTHQLGYNLPWERGVAFNLPPSTGSNPSQGPVPADQGSQTGNAQRTEKPLTVPSISRSYPPIPAPASVQRKAKEKVAVRVRPRPSTSQSLAYPSKSESMNSISQSSTRPVAEMPATQPQGASSAVDLSDNKGKNNRPGRSPAKGGMDGSKRARPAAKRKRKEVLHDPPSSKKRKVNAAAGSTFTSARDVVRHEREVNVATGSTSTNPRDAVHHGAESTLGNAQSKLEEAFVLNSEERFGFRQNHRLNLTRAVNPVTETSVGVLSTPADSNASPRIPLHTDVLSMGQSGKSQHSMSSPERAEISQFMTLGGPVINCTTALRGDQILRANQIPRATPRTAPAGKCLALRFFDSQLERRRDDGEAEKTRLLDAISWLTDLVLDANKAKVGAEGIVFTGEYAEELVRKLDEKVPITLWRKGLRLIIERADGTTTSLEPTTTRPHADVTINPFTSNALLTGKSKLSRFPKERPIDPATHWPVLAFCASNRRMVMDEPKQEAQRIIHLLNEFCGVKLEETDWSLEEAFSRKADDGSEIVVPRVIIITLDGREKVFTALSAKATKKLANSNILIFTDDEPFLWKLEQTDFGTLRTIPSTIEKELPFVSVSIPSIHPSPVFKPHCWVSSNEAATAPPLAFHNRGNYGNEVYQYFYEPLMPMNETDWREMARPLKLNF